MSPSSHTLCACAFACCADLDGSDGFSKDGKSGGSGYCGATIYGNILSASMGGALYTAAGNDNFTNSECICYWTEASSARFRRNELEQAPDSY